FARTTARHDWLPRCIRRGKGGGIRLRLPAFKGAMQIPCASLKIRFGIKKSLHLKTVDFTFMSPLVGGFFAHLHESALSVAAMFSWIEAALTPHDCFHENRITRMFGCAGAN